MNNKGMVNLKMTNIHYPIGKYQNQSISSLLTLSMFLEKCSCMNLVRASMLTLHSSHEP